MAVGNTFGATALSSYGGFWLSFAIILTPGGFEIESALVAKSEAAFLNSFGLFLMGWFIFTFLLLICTLRSTIAFFFLFFTLDMAFLLLGIGYLENNGKAPQEGCIVAGGAFGLMAAFAAWYNALAGIADSSNRYVDAHTPNDHTCMLTICPQLLRHSCRPFPMVRQGPREAHQGRQLGRTRRCPRGLDGARCSMI
jgi:succinate-acetate transporter protein